MTLTGSASENIPEPRYACVSNAEGFMIDKSNSPRAMSWANNGEPVAMRSEGTNFSPEPLPTMIHISRLQVALADPSAATCTPISQSILMRAKLAPLGTASTLFLCWRASATSS